MHKFSTEKGKAVLCSISTYIMNMMRYLNVYKFVSVRYSLDIKHPSVDNFLRYEVNL